MNSPILTAVSIASIVGSFSLGVIEGQKRYQTSIELEKPEVGVFNLMQESSCFTILENFFRKVGSTHPTEFAVVCAASKIPLILASVAAVESNADPTARSDKGAIGAWQVVPKWHGEVPETIPGQAAQAENIILTLLKDNDLYTALCKYNAGNNYSCREARVYAEKVLEHYKKLVVYDIHNSNNKEI